MTLTLTRQTTAAPYPIVATARVRDTNGQPVTGLTVQFNVLQGTAGAVTETNGDYSTIITPQVTSAEVSITAVTGALRADKVALVLPLVAPDWDQPEQVASPVSTTGYEDGPEVSPDGQWLVVSTYSFVDGICCLGACGVPIDVYSTFCQTVVGPSGGPERPGMLGADRIVSPTSIRNTCPKVCFEGPGGSDITTYPLLPVAAYGFRRNTAGDFVDPFLIGVDADGCGGPFGFSFVGAPVSNNANAVFAYSGPGSVDNDIWWTPLTLGGTNVLATYQCVNGNAQANNLLPTRIPITAPTVTQGNPQASGGYLWYDDEYTVSPPQLRVAAYTGTFPNVSVSAAQPIPLATPADDLRQPHFDAVTSRLYFTYNFQLVSAALSGDPAVAGSWAAPEVLLGAAFGANVGDIIVLGEPSVARPEAGVEELYFIYAKRAPGGGLNLDVGRVRKR